MLECLENKEVKETGTAVRKVQDVILRVLPERRVHTGGPHRRPGTRTAT